MTKTLARPNKLLAPDDFLNNTPYLCNNKETFCLLPHDDTDSKFGREVCCSLRVLVNVPQQVLAFTRWDGSPSLLLMEMRHALERSPPFEVERSQSQSSIYPGIPINVTQWCHCVCFNRHHKYSLIHDMLAEQMKLWHY